MRRWTYLNGMALLSGDGWVNWRDANRWSVYRPGWGAFLGGLELLTGADPPKMQSILSFLMAAAAPVFMLLILQLYPGGRDLLLAVVASMVFVVSPFYGWWFQRTMMSEGPTMLLALLFCLLTVRFCGRVGEWSWRQGLVLGLVGGAISLVRGQSRFGVLAVIALLALVSFGRLRRRLPFFVGVACALLALLGPLYLKTSIHLRMPYAGTSYIALYSVLDYTEIGRSLGGGSLPQGVELSEREATKLLQQRVGQGLRIGLSHPWEMAKSGFLEYSRFIHGAAGTAAKRRMPSRPDAAPGSSALIVLYSLTAIGLYFAWRRVGPVALVPLIFAAGYILPMVPLWFYRARFGAPISWVSLVYIAGAVLLFGGADVVARRRDDGADPETEDSAGPVSAGQAVLRRRRRLARPCHRDPAVDGLEAAAGGRRREALCRRALAGGPGRRRRRRRSGDGRTGGSPAESRRVQQAAAHSPATRPLAPFTSCRRGSEAGALPSFMWRFAAG